MTLITKKLLISILLVSCISQLQAKKRTQYFDQSKFKVDFTITHPTMSADFIGDANKELLLIGERENKHKIVVLYSRDNTTGSYVLAREIEIPKTTIAFDLITDYTNKERILLLDSQGLSMIDFGRGIVTQFESMESIYLNPAPQFVTKKELVTDVNGDNLDDIIVSGFDKISLLLQQQTSEFKKIELPIKPTVDMTSEHIAFSETRIFTFDVNFDRLLDIAVLEDNKLIVYEQTTTGDFLTITNNIKMPVEVSAVPWWFVRGADGESIDQSNLQHRMIESIEDINGDKIVDLMIRQTQSSGVFDRQNNYEIYYGSNLDGQLNFNSKVDTSISAEGTLSNLQLIDINNDGRKEILVSSFDVGVSQIIGALLSGSVDQDVYLFALNSNDIYNKTPLFSEEVDLNFSLSSGSTGQPVILSADLDGDGVKELMLSVNEKRLAIYAGEKSDRLLKTKSKRHKLLLPQDGSMLTSVDLNNDGREEVIVRYGKQDDEALRNTIIILTAK